MAYVLGVDLGTTYTAAATLGDGPPTMLGLGNRAMQVPSVVYVQPDGTMVFGEAAERRGAADPTRLAREFKRRISDPAPIVIAGTPYPAELLTAQLLRWVVGQATERLGEPPSAIVLTHPANWSRLRLDLLWQAIGMAGMPPVTFCPEPIAAAHHYATRNRVDEGDRICVYDLGGGTFDVCVLAREAAGNGGGFRFVGPPGGSEHIGGVDFDEAVVRRIIGRIEDDPQAQALLADPAARARLRRDCIEAKEALSADIDTVVQVAVGGGTGRSIRLTRAEFEDMIRPAIAETMTATSRTLQAAGVNPLEVSAFVPVGGSSRIPLVTGMLAEQFRRPIARGTHPTQDVALGAALIAARAAGTRPTVASASSPASPPFPPGPAGPAGPAGPSGPIGPSNPPGTGIPGSGAAGHRGRRIAIVAGVAVVVVAAAAATVFMITTRNATSSSTTERSGSSTAATGAASSDVPTSQTRSRTGQVDIPRSADPLPDEVVISPRIIQDSLDMALVDSTNGRTVGLIHTPGGHVLAPTISPDRRSIIYVDQPTTKLHVIAADGTGDRELFPDLPGCDGKMLRPGWNPVDPDELALVCVDTSGNYLLRIVRMDGQVLRRLDPGRPVVDDLTFSPDGTTVAFWAGTNSGWPDGGAVFKMPADGSQAPVALTDGTTDADPIFSPDGTLIAFRRIVDDGDGPRNMEIFVMNADGTDQHVLAPHPADDLDPAWSPDGSRIVFNSGRGNGPTELDYNHHLIMNADGTNVHRLAPDNPFPEEQVTAWGNR